MNSLLILPRIKVENANAVSGMIYGFPAITHFLGFVHAISRDLQKKLKTQKVNLGGCGIVCHNFQIHAHKIGGEFVFAISRNPLSKDGEISSFNEEGRTHLEVSIIIECNFTSDDFDFGNDARQDILKFQELIYSMAISRHLAGGMITEMSPVVFEELYSSNEKAERQLRTLLRKLLPGFVLLDRSDTFSRYLSDNPQINPFDGMMDFYTLKYKAIRSSAEKENEKISWERIPKPANGWIVPIQCGYKAISSLYEKGEVACSRDPQVPFRFVEPVYSLGEWVGLHRIRDIEAIIWRYQTENDLYICSNTQNNSQGS